MKKVLFLLSILFISSQAHALDFSGSGVIDETGCFTVKRQPQSLNLNFYATRQPFSETIMVNLYNCRTGRKERTLFFRQGEGLDVETKFNIRKTGRFYFKVIASSDWEIWGRLRK